MLLVHVVQVKILFLKWIIAIFELIPTKTRIHCLYGFLFQLIYNEALCPTVCHLLFLLTRKCDGRCCRPHLSLFFLACWKFKALFILSLM